MRIEEFNNIHDGERVFILGNGPSLQQTPLEKLDDEITIGLNEISKIYDDTDWRPSYFVFHDAVHEDWNQFGVDSFNTVGIEKDTIDSIQATVELGIPCFFSRPAERWFRKEKNALFYTPKTTPTDEQKRIISERKPAAAWSKDITEYVTCFASTISVCAQIANYMGFDNLYFLGCDLYEPTLKQRLIYEEAAHSHSFNFNNDHKITKLVELLQKTNHKYKTIANVIYLRYIEDLYRDLLSYDLLPLGEQFNYKTHFSDSYSSGKERSAHSMNKQMRRAHKLIKMASEEYEFEAYNATVGGHLEEYERVELEEVL